MRQLQCLADTLSSLTEKKFERRMQLLKTLTDMVKAGDEICLCRIQNESSTAPSQTASQCTGGGDSCVGGSEASELPAEVDKQEGPLPSESSMCPEFPSELNTQELLADTLCQSTAYESIASAQTPHESRPLFVSLDGKEVLSIPYFECSKSN